MEEQFFVLVHLTRGLPSGAAIYTHFIHQKVDVSNLTYNRHRGIKIIQLQLFETWVGNHSQRILLQLKQLNKKMFLFCKNTKNI